MYSSPSTTGPHGYEVPDTYGPFYPWHFIYIVEGVGPKICDSTGIGVHGIILPEDLDVVQDSLAHDDDHYFDDGQHFTFEDREHIETYAYSGGAVPIFTSIMTDGLGRFIQWTAGNNYTSCGLTVERASTGPDQRVMIHFHPAGGGGETDCTDAVKPDEGGQP